VRVSMAVAGVIVVELIVVGRGSVDDQDWDAILDRVSLSAAWARGFLERPRKAGSAGWAGQQAPQPLDDIRRAHAG
jgi:hypothetical protein